jgi:antitoxin HigA-1
MIRIPTNRPPVHPGEILREDFLGPMGLTQVELAGRLGIPFQRVNMIVREKRAVTPDTALRLARFFGTTVDLWLNLQLACDVYEAQHSPDARSIAKIEMYQMRKDLENFSKSMRRLSEHLAAKAAGGSRKKLRTG